jgi:glycosyltransferase involved in cell wall biosynthesis
MNSSPAGAGPRILFIPVSGIYGMGEYARSLAIACGFAARRPDAAIHFVLSREAPYALDAPFTTTLLPSSPTFHSASVNELIEKLRPDAVVFDNAGRTSQLRTARRFGARVVYISARRRQRRKAFRPRWMRLIDEHWIAYPEFLAGRLGFFERLKLKIFGRPMVRYLDVILPRPDARRRAAILSRAGCASGTFVLMVPGGGTGHPGAEDSASRFEAAGLALAQGGVATVYVGPLEARAAADRVARTASGGSNWHALGPLPQADLTELMRAARLVVANGGSTLVQAIACGNASIAVAIAQDQIERIRRCIAAGVTEGARLDASSIVHAVRRLLQDESLRTALAGRASRLGLADGVALAVNALDALIELGHGAVRE